MEFIHLRKYYKIIESRPVLKYLFLTVSISGLLLLGSSAQIGIVLFIFLLSFLRIIHWKYLFYLGLILMPVKRLGLLSIGLKLQMNQFFLFTSMALAFLDKKNGLKWRPMRFDVSLFFCIIILILSSFQSIYIPPDSIVIRGAFRNYPWIKSLTRVGLIILLVCFVLFIRAYVSNKQKLVDCMKVLFASSAVHSIIGLLGLGLSFLGVERVYGIPFVAGTEYEWPRMKSLEWEPLYFGSYLLTVVPVMFSMLLNKTGIFDNKKILYSIFLLNVVAIILTFSRGVWAGLVAALLFICGINYKELVVRFVGWYDKSRTNRIALLVCSIAALILLVYSPLSGFFHDLFVKPVVEAFEPDKNKFWSTRLRLMTIGLGLDMWKVHPFFGIGYENFSFYSGLMFINDLMTDIINPPDVNSLPFKILIETGLIGFFLIFWISLKATRRLINISRVVKDDFLRAVMVGYCAAFIGVGIQLLFFSNILLTYLWVMIGIILACVNIAKKDNGCGVDITQSSFVINSLKGLLSRIRLIF